MYDFAKRTVTWTIEKTAKKKEEEEEYIEQHTEENNTNWQEVKGQKHRWHTKENLLARATIITPSSVIIKENSTVERNIRENLFALICATVGNELMARRIICSVLCFSPFC